MFLFITEIPAWHVIHISMFDDFCIYKFIQRRHAHSEFACNLCEVITNNSLVFFLFFFCLVRGISYDWISTVYLIDNSRYINLDASQANS